MWMNDKLRDSGKSIEDLGPSLKNGVLVMEVLIKIAHLPPLKYTKRPLVVQQERDNWEVIVKFMRYGWLGRGKMRAWVEKGGVHFLKYAMRARRTNTETKKAGKRRKMVADKPLYYLYALKFLYILDKTICDRHCFGPT